MATPFIYCSPNEMAAPSCSIPNAMDLDLDAALNELGMLSTYPESKRSYMKENERAKSCTTNENFYQRLLPKRMHAELRSHCFYYDNYPHEYFSRSSKLKRNRHHLFKPYNVYCVKSPLKIAVLPETSYMEYPPTSTSSCSLGRQESFNKSNPSSPAKGHKDSPTRAKCSLVRSRSYDDVSTLVDESDQELDSVTRNREIDLMSRRISRLNVN